MDIQRNNEGFGQEMIFGAGKHDFGHVDGKISAEYKNGELKIEVPKNGEKKKQEGKHLEIR